MKEFNEKERLAYDKGIEDGYRIGKRLYKPVAVYVTTEDGDSYKTTKYDIKTHKVTKSK